jgi:osmotically-inducible protein OsmY
MVASTISPWTYPTDRYYYAWTLAEFMADREPSDGEIKKAVVERLKDNPHTRDDTIKVDVKQRVVILGGDVSSWLAKRAAGDDAWDTPGVVDVSNQLRPREMARS